MPFPVVLKAQSFEDAVPRMPPERTQEKREGWPNEKLRPSQKMRKLED